MTSPVLDREEYVEQAYFFRVFRERLVDNLPAQEILQTIHEEILSTTRLPMAIEFLRGEVVLNGRLSTGFSRLSHYFTPFQTFVMNQAEEDRSRFDQRTALEILRYEAEYRSDGATPAGLFVYQFESISRNRLGYDRGMQAMAGDPMFSQQGWSEWILQARLKLGSIDLTDLIYRHSAQYLVDRRRQGDDRPTAHAILFGEKEGRIAKANRGKDPLFMFAALQRQLGYPSVPRPAREIAGEPSVGQLVAKLSQLEKRLQLVEAEQRGAVDLSQFYAAPPASPPGNEPRSE
ncbi:MAG: hypothetical protein ACK5HA_14975 [Planctomycetaceae bacterium]|jgi:hypothetical protein